MKIDFKKICDVKLWKSEWKKATNEQKIDVLRIARTGVIVIQMLQLFAGFFMIHTKILALIIAGLTVYEMYIIEKESQAQRVAKRQRNICQILNLVIVILMYIL